MNKIYKLIWSKTKNCWVVASELAKGHGKNKSRIKNSLLAVFVMSALLAGGVTDVQALTQQEKDEIKAEVAKDLISKILYGDEIPGAKAKNFPEAIANGIFYYSDISNKIGEKLKNDGLTLRYFSVRPDYTESDRDDLTSTIGDSKWTNVNNDGAFGKHSMALGYRAFSEADHGVAIGRSSLAGGYKRDGGYGGDGDVAIGNMAWALGDKAVSIGDKAISADKSIAIGIQAEAGANKNNPNSIQRDPKTNLPYVISDIEKMNSAIAIGRDTKAWGHQSVSIGGSAKATGKYALSFGNSAEASAMDSFAFGNYASAKGLGAIAIGSGNYDEPNSNIDAAQAYSGDTIAIGRGAKAGNENDTTTAYNTVAVGREARAYGKNSIALGGTANVGDIWQKQLADGGTAIGSSSNAALENATAIGYKSIAYAKDAVTIGREARADIDGGVALGSESNVGSYSSSSYGKAGKVGYDPLGTDADGTSTWKSTKAAVSVGNQQKDITRQIINVAAGTDNTDAVNVAQLKTLGRKAWKDLAEAKDQLGARIATNTTSITALSGKVRTNTQDIGRLKTDVQTNDTRIRYLYDNMPFMHYVSVNEENTNKTTDNRRNDGAKAVGSIAIGVNTHAYGEDAVALGGNSFVRGQGSVIVGESSDNYTGGLAAKEGQFDQSVILGSNNTIFAQAAKNGGREDKIIGNMNRVEESNGTFVRGTGNMVYDAYNDEALTDEDKQKEQDFLDPIDGGDPTGLFQKGRSHVTVEGDGNLVGGALYTQVSGVGNEVSNSQPDENSPSTPRVTYNIVTGNRNTVVDSSHNLIMGDNHELENVNGNIIIGSQKTKTKTGASNVTVLGNDANVSVEGGVALGTGSEASTAAEVAGYDPLTGEASAKTTSTWKSGNGAVSVGKADKTRQITNLAAGTADTDAVNVAQLKNSKTAVEAGDYVTVTKKTEDGKGTTYTVKGPSLTSKDTNLEVTNDVDAEGKKVGYKLQLSKTLKGLTSVSSDEFKVGDKTYINKDGINANNNKITNVAAGAADGDAVNFKQLNDVNTQVKTNKNAIDALTPKVAANEGNITKLQAGFTVKDGGAGKADVTLGGDKKQEVTFKAAVDKTTQATADTKSLSSSVDADRNVTYTLNMSQLKKDLGITEGTDGVMSSWKLQAKGDTTPQDIKNGEAVTFDVAAADKGLTVTRDGKTIKYGIEGSKIDIANNQSITNLGKRIDNLPSIHYFSVKSDDSANPDGTNWKNDGATGKNAIAIGKDAKAERESSVVVGLNASSGDAANDGVAVGSRASVTGFGGVAIGRESSAEGQETVAIGTGAKGAIHRTVAIGGYANADGFGAVAIGRDSSSKERGVALGNSSFSHAYSVGVGEKAIAEAPYSVAVGDLTGSYAMGAVTLGNKTRAFGDSSVAIGNQARVSGKGITPEEYEALPKADQKLYRLYEAVYHNYDDPSKPIVDRKYYKVIDAHDWRAEKHYNSIAIGTTSFVEAKEAIGIGAATRINGDRGVALGYAAVSEEKGTALGAGAQAKANAGVALGEGAVADTAAEVAGYDPKTGKASTETTSTWKSVKGAVSVGNADATRQITNLAAGLADTDAVNVAQLKALEGKVAGNAGDITTLKAGWTLADAKTGKKVVKAEDTVKVTGDDYITATVGNDGLKIGMDETKLNSQINNQINDSETVKAKMNSWVLKATSDKDAEKDGKTIDNKNNAVTFDATGDGLTVTRDGSTITYGIDGSKIDIKGNKSITDLQTEIKESKTTVEAAANSQITVTPEKQNDKSTKYVVDIAKDGTIGGAKDGNLVTGKTVKDYVDANKVTVTDDGVSGVKVKNIAETGKPANYQVSLGDKIKAGDVTVDGTEGKGQITGLSNTTWDAGNIVSGRAATEDQLKAVSQNAAEAAKKHTTVVAGDYVTVSEGTNANGGKEYTVTGPKVAVAKDEKNLVVGDIMDGDKKVGYELKLNKELTGLTSVSSDTFKSGENVTINKDGLTIKEGPSVTTKGIDAGKKKITNVADGGVSENSTDAVNGGQLYKLQQTVAGNKVTVEAAKNSQITVTPETQADKSTKYVVDIAKDGTIGGAKDGNLVTGDTVKKYVDANKVTVTGDEDGSGVKVENVAEKGQPANYKVSLGDKVKIGNVVIDDKDGKGSISGLTEVKVGDDVKLDKTGLTIKDGPSVTKDGMNAGDKKITNVKDGDISETSTDAVNGKQLYELKQNVAENKVTVEAAKDSQITVTAEKQADKSTKYVVDIAKDGTIGGDKDGNLVTGDTVKKYVDANKVTVTGDEDGSGVKVENTAADGQPANYKVSLGNKIKAGDVTVDGTKGAGQITGLSNTTWDAGNIVSGRAATEDQLKAVSENAAEVAKKHTTVVAGDYVTVSEGTNANGGKEYTVTGPKVAVAKDEKNLVVGDIIDGNKKVGYELKLNKELTGLTSVSSTTFKAGDNVTINNEGLTIKEGPSVTTKGIDAGKKKITNVAAGDVSEKSTEAVNGGQLFGVEQKVNINSRNISILGGKVSELNTRVNRVGAGAAALAALHPLDFDPDDKWDFAAGYGNYKGANAAAIGAYYRPNEDTMVSVGGSFGGGENMVNAGVSVKLGQGNHVTTSRVAMAKEIKDLRAEVEVLRQAVTGIGQGQTPDPVKMKLFPDIAKNHWAYEAVEELTKQGLLEGYPDGTFGGDRMMTRYEFATLVYRAMQKGLNVNEKLIQEFEPELERFRIDVISKDKNGNPVIERVRVNEKKKAK